MTWVRMPLAPLTLALGSGIAAAPWTPTDVAWPVMIGALAWSASLAALGFLRSASVCLLVGVAAAGALRAVVLPPPPDHVARMALPAAAHVEARLIAEPIRYAPDRARLLVDVERVDDVGRSGRLQITVYGVELPSLTVGQRVAISPRLHRAAGFRNPGGFDYGDYLRRQDILVVGSARAEHVVPLDDPGPLWRVRVRRAAREAMVRSLPPTSAALLGGLLFGDRADLPPEIDQNFRRAGVYHVLAVSGFNVALVAGSVWALLALARAGPRVAAVGAMVAVVAFALVAGGQPSVLRAAIMGVVVLGAHLLDREASVLNSLALSALIILSVRPGDLLDPGFQLSFAATGGIVLAPLPRGLVLGALGVSLAAQLAVLPVGLAHFNQVSTLGLIANLAVVPLAGIATVLGLLAIASACVSDLGASVLLNATWPSLLGLRAAAAAIAWVPGALVHLPAPSAPAVVAYSASLLLGLWAWRRRDERAGRAAMIAAGGLLAVAVTIGAWPLLRLPDGRLRLTVLDVGQGDAIVLEAPDGSVMLIDAGSGGGMRLDAGERVVAPFLWNRGVLRLAVAVTTHEDQDHAGGMSAIRGFFRVEDQWDSGGFPPERQSIGGAGILVLHPRREASGSAETPSAARGRQRRNDDALVLRVDYGLASFLLASDITEWTERELLAARAPLPATVLKVAHHGARGSSTPQFLDRVRPTVAVISVGRRNSYGHPAPDTLARLRAVGARVYRTDRDGAVLFETDGRMLTVTGWATRSVERHCLTPEPADCESPPGGFREAISARLPRAVTSILLSLFS